MSDSKRMAILYACNDAYAPYVGVSICSLLENNKAAENVDIYVMSDNISETNKSMLNDQVQSYGYGRKISIVDCANIIEKIMKTEATNYRGSYANYLRLLFGEVVDSDIDKLLYLDGDTLVVGDLLTLFEIDLEDNYIGAVADSLGDMVKPLIGMSRQDFYLNSGVLLINTKEWLKANISEKILTFMREKTIKNSSGGDQEYILFATREKIKVLEPKYNLQPFHLKYTIKQYFKVYSKEGYYSEKALEESINNPVILHTFRYLGKFPFDKNNHHPAKEEFEKYKARSKWKDIELQKKTLPIFLRLEIVLYYILPKTMFLRVFRLAQTSVMKHAVMNKEL